MDNASRMIFQNDEYRTLQSEGISEIRVKDSRFIGCAAPAKNRQEAERFVQVIRKRYHDATHHPYAYRLGIEDPLDFRMNDDGEPSGTAGRPILETLSARRLTDVVCVVVRYFGGTKLGAAGLIRAYARSAAETLDRSPIVARHVSSSLSLRFPYELTGTVMQIVRRFEAQILETAYGQETELLLRVRRSRAEEFSEILKESTSGRVHIQTMEQPHD